MPDISNPPALGLDDLNVTYRARGRQVHAVRDVTLRIEPGACLGIVGESGSGKSTIATAVQGLMTRDPQIQISGNLMIGGTHIDPANEQGWNSIRGSQVTTIFQDPMTSLDPTMLIGRMLKRVTGSRETSLEHLVNVEIRDPEAVYRSYPHQLSGGMRQRVMIALALARKPALVVADEPTTALDVSVQAGILELLRTQQRDTGCGVLFITHDLGVARAMADHIAVMHQGSIVEYNSAETVFANPQHEYTTKLMRSRMTLQSDRHHPLGLPEATGVASMAEALRNMGGGVGAADADITEVEIEQSWSDRQLTWERFTPSDARTQTTLIGQEVPEQPLLAQVMRPALSFSEVNKSFRVGQGIKRSYKRVLQDVSFEVRYRESVAVVGESGSGKTTILRIAAGLERADQGQVHTGSVAGEGAQVIFQDAGSSLTPWMSVEDLLLERILHSDSGSRLSPEERRAQMLLTLQRVGLEPAICQAHPSQLSGGQRQRVAIARAVVVPPSILLCDEPTSALDVSVAATVLNMLNLLRHSLGISILFVTHDLAAARLISDRVLVVSEGQVVEEVPAETLGESVASEYGRRLLDAVLS